MSRLILRILCGLTLAGIVLFLAACTSEPAATEAPATATAVLSTAEPSDDAGTDEDDSSSGNSASALSTAAAARTPLPTPTPGPVDQSIDQMAAETGLAGQTFLGFPVGDWMSLSLSVLIVVVGYFIATAGLGRLFVWLVDKTSTQADNAIWAAIRADAKGLIVLLLVRFSTMRLDFLSSHVRMVADDLFFVIGMTIVTKMALTLISLAVAEVRARFAQQETGDAPTDGAHLDPVITALHRTADFFVLITALSIGLVHFGVNANAMYIVLLVAGVVLSFGAKDMIADAISGMIILVDQPFRPGDAILIEDLDTSGDVIRIGTRSTQIRTGDHREVFVPNAKIVQSEVVNYTSPESNYRLQTDLGVGYGADLETACQVIVATVRSVDGVLAERPVDVFYQSFGGSSRTVRVRWWIDSYHDRRHMMDKVNTALDAALGKANVNLPYTTYALQVQMEDNGPKRTATADQS